VRRSDGRAIRVSSRPGGFGPPDPERQALFEKISSGRASGDESERLTALMERRSEDILTTPVEELYDVHEVDAPAPPMARVFSSVDCTRCNEPTMETRLHLLDGETLCRPCFDQALAEE